MQIFSRKFLPQLVVAIAANGGAFIFGTLLGWSAPTADGMIENEDFKFPVTSNQFAWIVAMMALGATLSCVLSGVLRSKIGTRLTILLFGIPILVGWTMIVIPLNPAMIMGGRFLCGISAGCYSYVIPIYVGEISSNEVRGSLLSLFQVALNIGILVVFTVGHFSSLFVLNVVSASLALLYTLSFIALPESPPLLVSHQRYEDAKTSLKKLNGDFFNAESEVSSLKQQHEDTKAQKKSFSEVFSTKSTKKAFVIIMFQFMFFQMCGINGILLYSTLIFTQAGVLLEPGIASIVVSSVQVVSTLLAFSFVDRFGRKILLSLSNGFMCLSLIGIGIFFILSDAGNDVDALTWLPLTSLSLFVIAFSAGMGPVSYILLGELFMQDAKGYVAPIGQSFNFLLTFVIGLTFPLMTDAMGAGPTFLMFSAFCFLALLFTIFIIPETKGKSIAEIQFLLER